LTYDAIVVGGGHNGLTCAAYLAKAGLQVVVLEARTTVGGCASTVDALGARFNICNCDHVMVRGTPVFEDLDLARHGLRYLDMEPHILALAWNGSPPWFGFHDIGRTIESLAISHPTEVEAYRDYCRQAIPIAELLAAVTQTIPTPMRILKRMIEKRGRGMRTLLAWNRMSAEAVLRLFFTDEAVIAPALGIAPAVWGVAPNTPGTGLGALVYAIRHLFAPGRPVGGSGALPEALAAALSAHGGRIRCSAGVRQLLVEKDHIRGVALTSGEVIEARVVVSATDPRRTLVDWLTEPPPSIAALSSKWQTRPQPQGYESKIDAVVRELPRYRGLDQQTLERHGVADPLIPSAVIAPSAAGITEAHSLIEQGKVADRPLMFVNVPSVLDNSVRPNDREHVFSLEALFTPYHLEGGWQDSPEPSRWMARYEQLVEPGFSEGIDRVRVMAPPDYESQFGLTNGYAPSFTGGPLAALLGREPELTRYRTPIKGLYLTGAGTFPGAGIWGASGRNAAEVVLSEINQ
jgi:phytoene dehydrogenase-like protein